MRAQQPTRPYACLGVLIVTALAGATGTACGAAAHHGSAHGHAPAVRLVDGEDRFPSATAADWVTYADHVVKVTVTSSTNISPPRSEIAAGEGVILRDLVLTVDRVVWSSPNPARPAPKSLHWTAFGWLFKGDPSDPASRTEMSGEDAPRLELGESYLMAIEWEPARCSPGDDKVPAMWQGLGGDSTIPFSTDVLGTGELMGRQVDGPSRGATLDPNDVNYSLEDAVTGKRLDALTRRLRNAHPEEPENYGPPPAPCT